MTALWKSLNRSLKRSNCYSFDPEKASAPGLPLRIVSSFPEITTTLVQYFWR